MPTTNTKDRTRALIASERFAALRARGRAFGGSTALKVLKEWSTSSTLREIEAARALAHEALHVGNWKDVQREWRDTYAVATLVWLGKREGENEEDADDEEETGATTREKLLRELDLAAMLSGPTFLPEIREAIEDVRLRYPARKRAKREEGEFRIRYDEFSSTADDTVNRRTDVPMEIFYDDYMAKFSEKNGERSVIDHGIPVVLERAVSHWEATRKWSRKEYLRKTLGDRTVPIELGGSYMDDKWSQQLMTVGEFMDTYFDEDADDADKAETRRDAVGYLAQHELFEQCPELKRDVEEPMYCALGTGTPCAVNAWFGPVNTVSPAHTDPHHNLLCQVVGVKRVRLFSPDQTPRMYPHEGKMSNTSQVDVINPDRDKFPLFTDVEFIEATLSPGDALYIPPGWWHHVVAKTTSFSVSYWWD